MWDAACVGEQTRAAVCDRIYPQEAHRDSISEVCPKPAAILELTKTVFSAAPRNNLLGDQDPGNELETFLVAKIVENL